MNIYWVLIILSVVFCLIRSFKKGYDLPELFLLFAFFSFASFFVFTIIIGIPVSSVILEDTFTVVHSSEITTEKALYEILDSKDNDLKIERSDIDIPLMEYVKQSTDVPENKKFWVVSRKFYDDKYFHRIVIPENLKYIHLTEE